MKTLLVFGLVLALVLAGCSSTSSSKENTAPSSQQNVMGDILEQKCEINLECFRTSLNSCKNAKYDDNSAMFSRSFFIRGVKNDKCNIDVVIYNIKGDKISEQTLSLPLSFQYDESMSKTSILDNITEYRSCFRPKDCSDSGTGYLCLDGYCASCGSKNETCCEGKKCQNYGAYLSYACINDKCESCGGTDQPCCEENKCDSTILGRVCIQDKCLSCGNKDEPCCDGNTCDSFGQYTLYTCVSGTCKSCGKENEPCCGSNCDSSSTQCSNGLCVACGYRNKPCCGGDTCQYMYTCTNGMCVNK